ncbi:hypothetical protein Bbelb_032680 [Branchiostoma belcheri]|nr:hypothetical protein Bbelb_032680 [Branchiostoma belcheri]
MELEEPDDKETQNALRQALLTLSGGPVFGESHTTRTLKNQPHLSKRAADLPGVSGSSVTRYREAVEVWWRHGDSLESVAKRLLQCPPAVGNDHRPGRDLQALCIPLEGSPELQIFS